MELRDKVTLITGGKRVGREVALALATRGMHVALTYNRSKAEIDATTSEVGALGVRGLSIRADVSQQADVEAMIQRVVGELGRLDLLINMASIFPRTPLDEITGADFDRNIAANLKSAFLCSLAAAKVMRAQGGGKIINFSDWACLRPYPDYLPYLVSKGGVITLTKALAKELAPEITVNCIAPGPVLLPEDFSDEETEEVVDATLVKRLGSPKDIAATVLYLAEGTDFVTGMVIRVDGGRYLG